LQQHTHTGINTHRKQEDDDQRTDSALKNPTPSPHRPVRIPSHTGVLRFRLSVQETKEDTRTMHTVLIPRGRILHHFWDTQMVTVSALLDLCLFTPLFLPWKLFF
jgi:hypothetical protein